MSQKPTETIRDGINELCGCNDRTRGGVAGDMYLGNDVFIATIRHPRMFEGEWEDIDNTVDMLDLIDMHRRGD